MDLSSKSMLVLERMRMHGSPVSPTKISKETGLTPILVKAIIRRLITQGYIKALGENLYILTEKGKTESVLVKSDAVTVHEPVNEKTILGDRYVLEKSVGKGTYGEVWKAMDKSLERPVAVKLLHGGIKDFEQLKTEGKALSALTHKNIVIVHDLDSDSRNGWLVMEFIEGPSLQEYLENRIKEGKWLSFKEARDIVEQCLEALEFAHDKNRVHGDIKPANIFVPITGEVKLGDFGVAKILGGMTGEKEEYPLGYHRRLGSSSYAAPEVLKGQPRDFQSDLFSVGILAYLLLTGQHPFMHKSGLIPTLELIKSDTYVPPKPSELAPDLPEKYETIVMRLLEKDKSKRYQKAREVLDEWREKIKTIQCPVCNAENPILNKFCGQCGGSLGVAREGKSEPERVLSASFALFAAGRSQDAIKLIRQTLDKHSNFAKGWANLGYMLNYERMYEEAEEACNKSISLDPNFSPPYQTRGFARSNLGKFKDAIEDFTLALDKEKDERRQSMILYQRGYTRKLLGDFKEALKDATKALELDEANVKARRLKESLEPLV